MAEIKWKLVTKKVSELKPYHKNPRSITEQGLKDLKKSVDKFGLAEPIVINTDNVIIGGHARYLTLKNNGVKECDCYTPNRKLNDKEVEELNIRLNKNIAGEFDFDILANEFELNDLLSWGFEEKELDLNLWNKIDEEKLDEVPEPQKEAISKTGDLFLLDGKHRVLCGDSTKKEDVEKLMDGKKADMVFTDPPFPNTSKIMEDLMVGIEDAFNNARIFCNHTMIWFWDNLQNAPFGEKINARHIWHKTNGWQAGHFEMMNEHRGNNERGECKVYSYPNVGVLKRKDVGFHLTPKPVKLPEEIIKEKTKEGLTILDLFLGSGSTLIACEQTNRICYGMEIDPIYIDVILRRYHNSYPDKEIKCLNRKGFDFKKLYQA